MAFPRAQYETFIKGLFGPEATLFWKGAPEPFYAATSDGNSIIVQIDVGTAYGYGTSEVRQCWVPDAQGGAGAWSYYVLQRMTWPLTIDVETLKSDAPGEDFMMVVRNKLRWASSVKAIQDMGLTTIRVGNVISVIRQADGHESFGAILEISHGQCYALQETDNDGNVIETIASIPGVLTDAAPVSQPTIDVNMTNVQVGPT